MKNENILSQTRIKELKAQLKFFDNLIREFDGRTTTLERIAINNFRLTICDLLGICARQAGCYTNDIRAMPRTEYKFDKPKS